MDKPRYLSVCSGIEAASVAWRPLGWEAVAFSEIESFPCAVLKHHYPAVPNWGDMTKFKEWPDDKPDVLVGGTPCQSFSVAGLRAGLDDPRGQLAIVYLAIADRYRPRWVVWENVPGVLSADGGGAFGSFLGGLEELGYGWDYRVLDAQYFGVAQRRRRVFVVGYLGDWRRAAAVLFERESLCGHPPPRRQARQGSPGQSAKCLGGEGHDASEDGTGRGVPMTLAIRGRGGENRLEVRQDGLANAVLTPNGGRAGIGVGAIAFHPNQRAEVTVNDTVGALNSGGGKPGQGYPAVAYGLSTYETPKFGVEVQPTITVPSSSGGGQPPAMSKSLSVRRLTPRECERLQGFPDDYTLIPYRGKPAADGPRYRALGNSMAVPVMAWIGKRIQMVEDIA